MIGDGAAALLRLLDPETAHRATLAALKLSLWRRAPADDPALAAQAGGLFAQPLPNPIGLAAGFDKDAEVVDAMFGFGFGFVEIGTLTPRAQPGNPLPRVFRLSQDRAVVNRYGFNNAGHEAARRRLEARSRGGIVGVNIGANKESADRVGDYVAGVKALAAVADYFVVNVSSPNTPGLRDLQHPDRLRELFENVLAARDAAPKRRPLLVKIAPDLDLKQLDAMIRVAREARIDGMIVSNTTLARPAWLRSREAQETGGLSGAPLFEPSTRLLASTFLRVERQFPLIGVGGVGDAASAIAKLEAGASLVQLYTALIFEGPSLVARIKRGLSETLAREGATLASLTGRRAADLSLERAASGS